MHIGTIDLTCREGIQSPGVHLSSLARAILLLGLDRSGVDEAEIGFPGLAYEATRINALLRLFADGQVRKLRPFGWVRASAGDVDLAFGCCPDLRNLSLSVPVSDILIEAKFQGRRTARMVLDRASGAVERARFLGYQSLVVGLEDASRAPLERVLEFGRELISSGADRIRYGDTLGLESPFRIRQRVRELCEATGTPVVVHAHNDLGMAAGVVLAGILGGLDAGTGACADVTINGVGERAGNCDLLTLNMALRYGLDKHEAFARVEERTDLHTLGWLSEFLSLETGVPLPERHPVMGRCNNLHESGIHADGLLKNANTYRPFEHVPVSEQVRPDALRAVDGIRLGPYSGLKTLQHVYAKLDTGFEEADRAREVLGLVQEATRQSRRPLIREELIFIAHHPEVARDLIGGAGGRTECRPTSSTEPTCLRG